MASLRPLLHLVRTALLEMAVKTLIARENNSNLFRWKDDQRKCQFHRHLPDPTAIPAARPRSKSSSCSSRARRAAYPRTAGCTHHPRTPPLPMRWNTQKSRFGFFDMRARKWPTIQLIETEDEKNDLTSPYSREVYLQKSRAAGGASRSHVERVVV